MALIYLNMNGLEVTGSEGDTILDVAQQNGIEIPTLCHDERVKTFGSCGVCLVEVENMPRLVRACSTAAANGMVVTTNSPRADKARKIALELLLSDHVGDCRPPCLLACPGNTDCQGYVGLIGNGQYREALELIKDKIPMPASIGRVCPHPCEEACRRELVEEPISIADLKSFAADIDLNAEHPFQASIEPDTGKRVAVVGGGPGGLTAAYFLRRKGHKVTVFDAMSKMGGMLRYGIPEYRLPKSIVDMEAAAIEKMGVTMVNGVRVGQDISLDHIRQSHDATVLAIGAWTSTGLKCPGIDSEGVLGGIDFLRDVAENNVVISGKKVAVVGGGNTAMDACRTAVRLGAAEVYNIYRRTKAEMPAEEIEILEAEEEGVIFKYLTNPIEVIAENGRVSKIRLQKMELGEPDASGRRAPVPIPGAEETIALDTIILAIGQGVDPAGMDGVSLSKWNTILADETTYQTNIPGVFAVGDATNKGASIAIEAIGDAKRAADVIHAYLNGAYVPYKEPYVVKREMTAADFEKRQKLPREKMPHLSPEERRGVFKEVKLGFTPEQAKNEAKRCLECGCGDYFECKLIDYANRYDVNPAKFDGEAHHREQDESNPFITRNPDKCILCGLCVRVCDEVMGRTALGLVGRGFDTMVKPELDLPLAESDCISCGQCVSVCPTGALLERLPIDKPVPVDAETTHTVCAFCSVGCKTKLETKGRMLLRSMPDDDADKKALLCAKGRFGFDALQNKARVAKPMIRKGDKLAEAGLYDALMETTKKAQGIAAGNGANALAVAIGDKYTNEDIFAISQYAKRVLKTDNVYSLNGVRSGLADVFGAGGSTTTFDEMDRADVIVLLCEDIVNSHTIAGVRVKQAVENGAKLVLVSTKETQANEWATIAVDPGKNLDVLKAFAKAVMELKGEPKNASGFKEFKAGLENAAIDERVREAAKLYANAKKAVFVFEQNAVTTDAARLVADIAVLSGHVGKARAGVIALLPNNNSQGLADMGVRTDGQKLIDDVDAGKIKGLLIFGEDAPALSFGKLEFLMVSDTLMTETAEMADVVLPAASSAESTGTTTSAGRKIQKVRAALPALCGMENWQLAVKLANVSTRVLPYETLPDVQKAIGLFNEDYKRLEQVDCEGAFTPIGQNPVRFANGFATEDGKACLRLPDGNLLFGDARNTHGAYNRFMNFMDSKALIK